MRLALFRCFFAVFSILLLTSVSDLHAQQATDSDLDSLSDLQRRVLVMLSGYETFPNAEQWQALEPEAADELMTIATDVKQWPLRRARAVLALAYFPTKPVLQFLSDLFTREDPIAPMLRRKAIQALATGFPKEAVSVIKPNLQSTDFYLREVTIDALLQIRSPQAMGVLKQHRQVESNELILEKINRAFAREVTIDPKP